MEGLVEIQQAQSSGSLNTVSSTSTLSLKKLFGSMILKKPRYDTLGSDTESVKSFASGKSKSSQKSSKSTNTTLSTKSNTSTSSKASKLSYSVDRFSGPKNVPNAVPTGNYKSKSYHEACWSQAYAFGGR